MALDCGDRKTARRLGLPEYRVRRWRRRYVGKPLRKRLAEGRTAEVVRLLETGMSATQIAKNLGISLRALLGTIDWAGYEYRLTRTHPGRPPQDPTERRLRDLAEEGVPRAEMMADTGLSAFQVWRRLDAMGYRYAWVKVRTEDTASPASKSTTPD